MHLFQFVLYVIAFPSYLAGFSEVLKFLTCTLLHFLERCENVFEHVLHVHHLGIEYLDVVLWYGRLRVDELRMEILRSC